MTEDEHKQVRELSDRAMARFLKVKSGEIVPEPSDPLRECIMDAMFEFSPEDEQGAIAFSEALYKIAAWGRERGFLLGARVMREIQARFVEQGGDACTAASIRANWVPSWGTDPGKYDGPHPVPAFAHEGSAVSSDLTDSKGEK